MRSRNGDEGKTSRHRVRIGNARGSLTRRFESCGLVGGSVGRSCWSPCLLDVGQSVGQENSQRIHYVSILGGLYSAGIWHQQTQSTGATEPTATSELQGVALPWLRRTSSARSKGNIGNFVLGGWKPPGVRDSRRGLKLGNLQIQILNSSITRQNPENS